MLAPSKSQALLDDAAILACMTHVDLNPIRAGGAVDRLQRFGQRPGRYWLHGTGASRRLYQQPAPAQ